MTYPSMGLEIQKQRLTSPKVIGTLIASFALIFQSNVLTMALHSLDVHIYHSSSLDHGISSHSRVRLPHLATAKSLCSDGYYKLLVLGVRLGSMVAAADARRA